MVTPTKTYYKDYLINGSQYVFAGYSPSNGDNGIQGTRPSPTGFSTYSGQALDSFHHW